MTLSFPKAAVLLAAVFCLSGTAFAENGDADISNSSDASVPADTPADTPSSAESPAMPREGQSPQLEGVDIPTADVLDPATFSTSFRFYNEGGITSRLLLGPFKRVNLGIQFDTQRVIGSDEPHMIRPSVFFKLRAFDGNDYLPALALGYDNQGYLYQESTKRFLQDERGIYLVGSHEILLPAMELHAGANIPDVEHAQVFGFVGLTWKIVPTFALIAEYDNIRDGRYNRVNLGGRLWVTSFFNIDLAARNVGRRADRGAERIVRLNYVARFPF